MLIVYSIITCDSSRGPYVFTSCLLLREDRIGLAGGPRYEYKTGIGHRGGSPGSTKGVKINKVRTKDFPRIDINLHYDHG